MNTSEKKSKRISVRLSASESHQLCENAKLVGMKPSSFMRAAVLAIKIPAPISDRKLMLQLAKIGGNLNQCSRKLNIIGAVDEMLLNAINDAINEVHEVHSMFKK